MPFVSSLNDEIFEFAPDLGTAANFGSTDLGCWRGSWPTLSVATAGWDFTNSNNTALGRALRGRAAGHLNADLVAQAPGQPNVKS